MGRKGRFLRRWVLDLSRYFVAAEAAHRPRIFAQLAFCLATFILIIIIFAAPPVVPAAWDALAKARADARAALGGAPHGAVVALVTLAGVISEFPSGALVANWRRVFRDVLAPGTIEAPRVRSGFWCVGSV